MSTNYIIPTNLFVTTIQQHLSNYPSHSQGNPSLPMPYTIIDICSRCTKIAAAPNSVDAIQTREEIRANLNLFDTMLTTMLMADIETFVRYLIQRFRDFGWYSADGTAPHRFVGFRPNSFDMEVRSS